MQRGIQGNTSSVSRLGGSRLEERAGADVPGIRGNQEPIPKDLSRFDASEWLSEASRYTATSTDLRPSTVPTDNWTGLLTPDAPQAEELWKTQQQLGAVQKRLRPHLLNRFAESIRSDTPLFEITAALIAPYLVRLYNYRRGRAVVAEELEGHVRAANERLTTIVAGLFTDARDGFDPWQGLAEWMFTHMTAWAVDAMEERLGGEAVREMTVDQFNRVLTDYLLDPDSGAYRERRRNLLYLYAQELAQLVVEALDVRDAPADRLERLIGLRPLRKGDLAPGRQPSTPRDPLSPLGRDGHLTVMSSAHYHALREALYKNTFRKVEGTPWPTAPLQKGSAVGQAQLRPPAADAQSLLAPDEMERWAAIMWQQREELTDLDADALDALSAIWLHQARDVGDRAVADVDRLLAMRGIKPKRGGQGRRGGYEAEQRAEMMRALSHIQNLWVNIAEVEVYEEEGVGRRRKATKQTLQSRPFVITDRVGQLHLNGYMDVRKFVFRPGEVFAAFLMGPGHQVALLSAKALKYDPYRNKREKRLARYLSWQWRTKARSGGYLRPYKVVTLLEAVGEEPNLNKPSRTRDRLEQALDTLQTDEVIAGWQYDRWDESVTEHRGWAQHWLQATVLVEPPQAVVDQYQHLERQAAPTPLLAAPATVGERIKARRNEAGMSQMQAAEALGVSQGYYNKLENGKASPSRQILRRLREWLGERP